MKSPSSTNKVIETGMLNFLDSFLKYKGKGKDKEQTK